MAPTMLPVGCMRTTLPRQSHQASVSSKRGSADPSSWLVHPIYLCLSRSQGEVL